MYEVKSLSNAFWDSLNLANGLSKSNFGHPEKDHEVDPFLYDDENWVPSLKKIKGFNNTAQLFNIFQKISLTNMNIKKCDPIFSTGFANLEELSLTGNLLTEISSDQLPQNLQVLHLNANIFTTVPVLTQLKKLLHLGMSYNKIQSPVYDPSIIFFPANLVSLDLSFNNIESLINILDMLQPLQNLRLLALMGNPVCLAELYRAKTSFKIPSLTTLDEKSLIDERPSIWPDCEERCRMIFTVSDLIDLPEPPAIPVENSKVPPEIYHFCIEFIFHGYNNLAISTSAFPWQETPLSFNFKKVYSFPITQFLRDAINCISVSLVRKKIGFILPEVPPPTEEVPQKTAAKAPKAKEKKPVKGKKGAAVADDQWIPQERERIEIYTKKLNIVGFFTGEKIEESLEIEIKPEFQAGQEKEKSKKKAKSKQPQPTETIIKKTMLGYSVEVGSIDSTEPDIVIN